MMLSWFSRICLRIRYSNVFRDMGSSCWGVVRFDDQTWGEGYVCSASPRNKNELNPPRSHHRPCTGLGLPPRLSPGLLWGHPRPQFYTTNDNCFALANPPNSRSPLTVIRCFNIRDSILRLASGDKPPPSSFCKLRHRSGGALGSRLNPK